MHVRADYHNLAWQLAEEHAWQPSPMAGVERILLDRRGGELAVATSIVRYAPGAHFSAHGHDLGEEFIVLEGEFADEAGRYPAGTYVRNPPGSGHTPFSDPGCVLFVKLRQFDPQDRLQSVTTIDPALPQQGQRVQPLHTFGTEEVCVIAAAEGERVALPGHYELRELLVLAGQVTWQTDATRTLNPWSWVRMPPGHPLRVVAQAPSLLFAKTRPLTAIQASPLEPGQ